MIPLLTTLAALLASAPQELVQEAAVPLDGTLLGFAGADVDRDGQRDLVVLSRPPLERDRLSVFRRSAPATFDTESAATFDLPADVIGFAVGELTADAGAEILLLSHRGAYSLSPSAPEASRYTKLLEIDLLWLAPDSAEVHAMPEALRDLNGDGLSDLVLPQPGRFLVAFQRRTAEGTLFETAQDLPVPGQVQRLTDRLRDAALSAEVGVTTGLAVGVQLGADPLLRLRHEMPAPFVLDFDGDRRLDLVAQTDSALYVWRQRADQLAPATGYASPVPVDEQRTLDVSYSSHLADLDGDAAADWLLTAGDQRSKDPRTQVLWHLQRTGPEAKNGPFDDQPTGVLVLDGFLVMRQLVDVDADGDPDLVLGALRPDLLSELSTGDSEEFEFELTVYRNDGEGRFTRRPVLQQRIAMATEASEGFAQLVTDATGDGGHELLLRDRDESVQLIGFRPGEERWEPYPRPLWTRSLEPDAAVLFRRGEGGAGDHIVLRERKRLVELVW